jgi:LPXTG-motif cell wall-anchored protein
VTSSADKTVSELPQTGPADSIAVFAIIGIVTYFAASFISSRKSLLENTRA